MLGKESKENVNWLFFLFNNRNTSLDAVFFVFVNGVHVVVFYASRFRFG